MIIDNQSYPTDLVDVNNMRYLLFTNLYSNANALIKLTEIIAKHIECLSIDYNAFNYTFTVKIKKTAMRRLHGFRHDPNFYYQIIPDIFSEFITANKDTILAALASSYQNPTEVLNSIYMNKCIMANLCHISCISDNIIVIKL